MGRSDRTDRGEMLIDAKAMEMLGVEMRRPRARGGALMAASIVEINFDGIIGPSHNYAGLSLGNLASARNAGDVSNPRAAALQGLDKMRANLRLGLAQGLFVPPPRPATGWLAALGTTIDAADPRSPPMR